MYDHTSGPARPQPARLPWPGPVHHGCTHCASPAAHQVTWPEFLRLTAKACEQAYPGSPGRFLGANIHALAARAVALQADSPEVHAAKAEAERLREAAYLHALEQGAATLSPAGPDCDLGGWGGHPDAEWFASRGDEAARRVWLGDPACDDTYAN